MEFFLVQGAGRPRATAAEKDLVKVATFNINNFRRGRTRWTRTIHAPITMVDWKPGEHPGALRQFSRHIFTRPPEHSEPGFLVEEAILTCMVGRTRTEGANS